MFAHTFFVILFTLPLVSGGGWDDFSNNLATDLAPFLSLFGEEITKQYLSESITVTDYFIFAMAPMGILTAVVSAIREGAGNAEAELCSSTSRDVCELYNSGGIARVFGRPKILEVVHDPKHDFSNPEDVTAGIYTFQEYVRGKGKEVWKEKKPKEKTTDAESASEPDTPYTELAPNLSLNIGIKKPPIAVFKAIALLGLILQLGVVTFAGVVTYYLKWSKNGSSPDSYACPLVIIGTTIVCGGMFHCAFLIGQTTKEDVWVRTENDTNNPSMYWVQPGGQIIGDQTFDAFSYTDSDNKLIEYTRSRKEHESKQSSLGVWIATGTTISGFVLQFIGLRGIHSAISVAQLGVIMVMSMVRAALRMQRLATNDNCFAKFPDEVVGYELDWLALHIGRDVIREDMNALSPRPSSSSLSYKPSSSPIPPGLQCRHFWRLCGSSETNQIWLKHPASHEPPNAAAKLLAYRTRLASLTDLSTSSMAPTRDFKSEMVQVRGESRHLAALIEATVKSIFSKAKVKKPWKDASSMFWGIDCTLCEKSKDTTMSWNKHTVYLEFTRDPYNRRSPWKLKNKQGLEAVLGLWVWSLKSDPAIEIEDLVTGLKRSTAGDIQARRIIPTDQAIKPDLRIWLGDDDNITEYNLYSASSNLRDPSTVWTKTGGNDVRHIEKISSSMRSVSSPQIRFFGWKAAQLPQSQNSAVVSLWSAPIKGSLVSPCAQEVFASFIASILDIVDDIGPVDVQEAETFRLENILVTEIVGLFTEMQLGSRQEALLCVMPLMIPQLKMRSAESALEAARTSANQRRRHREWKKAEEVLKWAWSICTESRPSCSSPVDNREGQMLGLEDRLAEQATITLAELYRWALMYDAKSSFGRNGISWLKTKKSSQSVAVGEVIDRYVDVANRIARNEVSHSDFLTVMENGCVTSELLLLLTQSASKMKSEQKGKALCLAVKHRCAEVVRALLELGSEPDFQDTGGRTALSYAAAQGDESIVKELLQWGGFPNSEDILHRTPLSYASEAGFHRVTELLLRDNRVSPDSTDINGWTPLFWAAQNGNEPIVKQLLQNNKVDPGVKDSEGWTPLLLAAQSGYRTVVEQFIRSDKVDLNAKDSDGCTPLLWAAQKGYTAIVKLLLETGQADLDTKDSDGWTPLYLAAYNGHEAVVKLLLETKKVDPDLKNRFGRTPLWYAAQKGYEVVVEHLLRSEKVDPNAKDNNGCMPLLWAARNGHEAVVKLLLQKDNVDPDSKDGKVTPLWYAARNGHAAVVKQLLETKKVDPNIMDIYGRTPLLWAAQNGHEGIVEQLLQDVRTDPEAKDNEGWTPLLWAARNGHGAVVKQLQSSP
ncbi:hypothetical protein N7490_005883 [Penicillium lividum]|nr:hypothetical protein N7490_005883 [Penicillium lividum]